MIYLDNAATSWPKPEAVYTTMDQFIRKFGANPGRAGHQMAVEAERVIFETRNRLARFFNAPAADRVIFTLNATDSLNIALKGLLKSGNHVLTSPLEHNSVVRPLNRLMDLGIEVTKIDCDHDGKIDLERLRKMIKTNTKVIVINHASNVLGTIQPIHQIGQIAKEYGILFLVDAAQSAGHLRIDVQEDNIDLLACSGHKGLYGPPGTGVLLIKDELLLTPLREGGTGSVSESLTQPTNYPHRLESGTPNTVGIAGIGAGVKFIEETGLATIKAHEEVLLNQILEGLNAIPGVAIYGPNQLSARTGVVSFNIEGWEPTETSMVLDSIYGIAARAGLHCAPLAHQVAGTLPFGTVRVSPGYFNTREEIHSFIEAVRELAVHPN